MPLGLLLPASHLCSVNVCVSHAPHILLRVGVSPTFLVQLPFLCGMTPLQYWCVTPHLIVLVQAALPLLQLDILVLGGCPPTFPPALFPVPCPIIARLLACLP